ncbi:hypothetical protein PUN28_017469 [Cardiocondyla obscurior]|uniref:Uncharacterized protein n=1 Tax=Cardiocondyla obscurior TaxID=286306 RepID=A0AAW2EJQ8_9HYME
MKYISSHIRYLDENARVSNRETRRYTRNVRKLIFLLAIIFTDVSTDFDQRRSCFRCRRLIGTKRKRLKHSGCTAKSSRKRNIPEIRTHSLIQSIGRSGERERKPKKNVYKMFYYKVKKNRKKEKYKRR